MAFLQFLAPNGQRWLEYCGAAPPSVDPSGKLTGAWGECMSSAVVFEITHEDWDQDPDYAEQGPGGQVISYAEQCGYGAWANILETAEQSVHQEMEGAESDPFAFLRGHSKNGKTWKEYCCNLVPLCDANGFVTGAWGDCITAAVIFEHQNPGWDRLPMYEDGPAGQALHFLCECGFGEYEEALARTEEATHMAIDSGGRVPVHAQIYQPILGAIEAVRVDELPPQMTGKKKALLIGCNYSGSSAELNGCINDVEAWHSLLLEVYGFDERDVVVLRDDEVGPLRRPTLQNMRAAMQWLVSAAQPGDVLFCQFSGHGTQLRCRTGEECDGKDEALCPCDFQETGYLVDDEIFDVLVQPLMSGVKLTIILDCCHSGTAVDLPFIWRAEQDGWEEVPSVHSAGDVQMFSGCEDCQVSMDVTRHGRAGGAMTQSLTQAIREDPDRQYPQLLERLHEILEQRGMEQRPQLTSSQCFEAGLKTFNLCEGAVSNRNPILGSDVPRRRQANRDEGGVFATLFGF